MTIDKSILDLEQQEFTIESDEENYRVSFPDEKSQVWGEVIKKHLKVGYWNEYMTENKVIFIFHLEV